MRILIIEDDKILRDSLGEYLKTKDIDAQCLQDEREYEAYLNVNAYDVLVIDLMLRHLRGEDIIRRVRKKGIETPILVLTAKTGIADKEVCFGLGADDYLTKPFDLRELVMRLKALAGKRHVERIARIGDAVVDMDSAVIRRDGQEIPLSKRAWDLLQLLIKHRGEVVSSETIMNYVWGDTPVGDEIIRTYIKNLRKVLPDDAITTYKGRGYRLD
jgi:DNA-binding response OmpR family regulator